MENEVLIQYNKFKALVKKMLDTYAQYSKEREGENKKRLFREAKAIESQVKEIIEPTKKVNAQQQKLFEFLAR